MVFDGQKFTGRSPAQFNSGTGSERKKEKTGEKIKSANPRRGSSRQGFFSGIVIHSLTPSGRLLPLDARCAFENKKGGSRRQPEFYLNCKGLNCYLSKDDGTRSPATPSICLSLFRSCVCMDAF